MCAQPRCMMHRHHHHQRCCGHCDARPLRAQGRHRAVYIIDAVPCRSRRSRTRQERQHQHDGGGAATTTPDLCTLGTALKAGCIVDTCTPLRPQTRRPSRSPPCATARGIIIIIIIITCVLRLRDGAANKPRGGGWGSRRGSPTTPQASYACRPDAARPPTARCYAHPHPPAAHNACANRPRHTLQHLTIPNDPPAHAPRASPQAQREETRRLPLCALVMESDAGGSNAGSGHGLPAARRRARASLIRRLLQLRDEHAQPP
jgi:hypothetical protein